MKSGYTAFGLDSKSDPAIQSESMRERGEHTAPCRVKCRDTTLSGKHITLPHSALESHASQTPFVVVVVVVVGSVAMARCISLWKFSVLVFMLEPHAG